MPAFLEFKPARGIRQPRIQYRVDDPAMAELEEFRAQFGSRALNAAYIEALRIGARAMMARQRGQQNEHTANAFSPAARPEAPSVLRPATPLTEANPAASVGAGGVACQDPAPATAPHLDSANAVEPSPVGGAAPQQSEAVLRVPPMPEPQLRRKSSAAAAQFKQFG